MKAKGEFKVTSWNQTDLDGVWNDKRIMKVNATFEVHGEINGHISVAYLMYYSRTDSLDPHNGTAQYTGYLAFCGKIRSKEGSFILQDSGVYANSAPASIFSVVGGSGAGDLIGITGNGRYYAKKDIMVMELEYSH